MSAKKDNDLVPRITGLLILEVRKSNPNGDPESTRDAFNEDKETNELIKSCFSTDRIEILKENRVGFILYLYIDSNGIVREVEILVHNKYVKMIYDEEIKCICNTLKGLKKSIPPAYVDFAFHKIGHGFFF